MSEIILAPNDVIALWDHLGAHFGGRVVHKQDAREMLVIARALDMLGVLDQQDFLDRYTTTIWESIYTPFVVGTPSPRYPLISQAIVGPHEFQHIVQHQRDPMGFTPKYLASSACRAGFETEALGTTMEIEWFLLGYVTPAAVRAKMLRDYACSADDIEVTRIPLEMRQQVIKRGGVETESGKVSIAFLKERLGI